VKSPLKTALFAALSLGCVAVGYLLFGAFVVTGTNRLLGSGMEKVARFAILSPCLVGIVLAPASLIWNPGKLPGMIALVVAVAGTCLLYSMGG